MRRGKQLTIVGYHNITPTPISKFSHSVGVRGFRQQVRTLRKIANVVPLHSAVNALRDGRELPPRAVAITFDDGYRDALDVAAPILLEYGMPATFFVVSGFASGECEAWWERLGWAVMTTALPTLHFHGQALALARRSQRFAAINTVLQHMKTLNRDQRERELAEIVELLAPQGPPSSSRLFLDWDGCRALVRHGFAIGSHSEVHTILAREDPAVQRQELARSRETLEAELDVSVDILAYPNGRRRDYSSATIEAARSAGYSAALTTVHGRNDASTPPFELRRVIVSPELGALGIMKAVAQIALAPLRARDRSRLASMAPR